MGREGKKQKFLKNEVCKQLYEVKDHLDPKYPTIETALESSDRYAEICDVYKALGGIMDSPKLSPGSWDIITRDFIIELDEENHFNRYRAITLDAPLYRDYRNFSVKSYRKYCDLFEPYCRTDNGFWRKDSSDNQYGASNRNGDLSGNGSSRWRQRAFYDYLRDAYSVVTGLPVYRISIYEKFGDTTIGQILESKDVEKTKEYLRKRIKIKSNSPNYSEL